MSELILKLPPNKFVFREWEIFDEPEIYQKSPETDQEVVLCQRTLIYKGENNRLVWSIEKEPNALDVPEIRICYTFDNQHYYHCFNNECLKKNLLTYEIYENLEEMAGKYFPNYFKFSFANDYYTAVDQPNSLQIAMQKCDDFHNFVSNYSAFL